VTTVSKEDRVETYFITLNASTGQSTATPMVTNAPAPKPRQRPPSGGGPSPAEAARRYREAEAVAKAERRYTEANRWGWVRGILDGPPGTAALDK